MPRARRGGPVHTSARSSPRPPTRLALISEETTDRRVLIDDAGVAEGPRRIQAHMAVDAHQHVARAVRLRRRVGALGIAVADDAPALDPRPGEHHRVAGGPVVAAAVLVDLRVAAELGP